MKEIRAYIQPHVLFRLTQALSEIPRFPGMSVSDCEGFGSDKIFPGQDFTPLVTKKRLEIFSPDAQVESIVATILQFAHSGLPGDGKVYILDVKEQVTIRSGERKID